jgi:hydroxymethylpyrimidine kinase/phosphomethylpyrimidine kinase
VPGRRNEPLLVTPRPMNIALTIAGSDSGGGAGIQADLKTFHQFGVFGTSVVAAITAQNTRGVSRVFPVPAELLEAQLAAVAEDLRPAATKSGMLATRALVEATADGIARHGLANYVLDPVMVASSGDRLLERDAERALTERLVRLATVVTPNLDEARIMVEHEVRTPEEMEEAGHALVRMGAKAALVKGGHLSGTEVVDVLVTAGGTRPFRHARIETTSTHGTGCTLSAGIAAGLARGASLDQAAAAALDFVHRAIQWAPRLGSGTGPLNHFVEAPE